MNLVIGLLVPFLGTSLGAACVFFMKNGLNRLVQKALLGFASGVMVAASVWSLLIPSIDMSEGMGKFAFLPAAIGFIFGILFLLLMDKIIPHLHMNEDKPEGLPSHLKKTTMLVLAVTLFCSLPLLPFVLLDHPLPAVFPFPASVAVFPSFPPQYPPSGPE